MKNFIYRLIRRKQDNLKRHTDRRFEGLWMAPAPKLLEALELLAGDVLFCGQAKRDKLTELIQNTTDGVYVHCGIYVGDNAVVHAVGAGVREVSLEQFVSDYAYVAVTRSPGANSERSKEIAKFARSCVNAGHRYNYIGAAPAPLRECRNIKKILQHRPKEQYYLYTAEASKRNKEELFLLGVCCPVLYRVWLHR